MAIEKEIIIKVDTSQGVTGMNALNKEIEKTTDSTGNLKKATSKVGESSGGINKIKDTLGNLAPTFKGAIDGAKALGSQLLVLVANPIVATVALLVAGLALLFKAFSSTKAGAEKIQQVMAGISATVDVLRDRVLVAGKAIAKFFSGDFKGAISDARSAVSGIGAEIEKEFKQVARATKELQRVADAERDLGVSRSALNKDLAESERILTSSTASYAEKLKALKQVEIAEKKQTDAELANAKRKLEATIALTKGTVKSAEDLDKIAEAQIKVNELEQKSAEDRRKISDFNKTLASEELARINDIKAKNKEASDARIAQAKAEAEAKLARDLESAKDALAIQKELQESQETPAEKEIREYNEKRAVLEANNVDTELLLQIHLQNLQKIKDADLLASQNNQNALLAILEAEADKEIDLAKKVADEKKRIREIETQAITQTASTTFGLLSSLSAENSEEQKAFSAAQALINTYQGISAGVKLGYPAAIPAVIAAATTGFAAVKNILSTKNKVTGGVPSGVGGNSVPVAPPSFNLVQGTGSNQIAEGLASETRPIKAYVVGTEITTQQSLDRNIVSGATLGG